MNKKLLTYRELHYPFTEEIDSIFQHFGQTKKYKELLFAINTFSIKLNGFPYQKDLLKKLSLKRGELVDLMNDLYQDFQNLMCEEGAYCIHETEIQFIANDKEQVWIVGPGNLKILPRLGEIIYLPSLTRDHEGASYFRVNEIIHEISGRRHVMEIHMKGSPFKEL